MFISDHQLHDQGLVIRRFGAGTGPRIEDASAHFAANLQAKTRLRDFPPCQPNDQRSMHAGAIRRAVVDYPPWAKLVHDRARPADVQRITVTEHKRVQSIDAARVQIIAQETLVIARAPGIKKPIAAARAQMHSGARAGIEHGQLCARDG
jgi:hypothetical protein